MAIEQSQTRNESIDFSRGLLALFMVLYHAMNYALTDSSLYKYVRFIAPGYILLSGLVITQVLAHRYAQDCRTLHRRLLVRGLKLLAMFSLLNLAVPGGRSAMLREPIAVFVVGDAGGTVFEILLYISYLMLLSPAVLGLARADRLYLYCLSALLLGVAILGPELGMRSPVASNLAFGILGMAIGNVHSPAARWSQATVSIIVACAVAVYVAVANRYAFSFAANLWGTLTALGLFGLVCQKVAGWPRVYQGVLILGRHSLFAYLFQIAVLQALARLRPAAAALESRFWPWLVITLILTVLSVYVVEWVVGRSTKAKAVYRAVFA